MAVPVIGGLIRTYLLTRLVDPGEETIVYGLKQPINIIIIGIFGYLKREFECEVPH